MLVETSEGAFVLEDMFGDWAGTPEVIEAGAWPPHQHMFETREKALSHAATIITARFHTDLAEWLEAAGITINKELP